ncbi:translation initiation factor IF-2-like [Neomonachus schauinslandi]|uniref:Translation initiation factor IF-2-like n=1 Tax=Neomonachus schauinslandi TaxID=29088 RepID=A0A8M1MEZ0_NEOSC|nr:translation initiation factor IF-2-like [Neomonachus schauinslandi]
MRQANSRSGCEERLSGFRWVNPRPHRGERHLGAAVGAPQSPTLRAAVAAQAARGRPGPRVEPGPAPPSRPPPQTPSAPRGRAPDPAAGSESLLGADARPAEDSPPFPRGQYSRLRTPLPTSRGKPRAASGQRPLRGRALAPRLDGGTECPPVPPSLPQLPTRSPLPAGARGRANPRSPRRSVPVARLPSSPGSGQRLPTCGCGAERGLQPLPPPAAARESAEPLGAPSAPTAPRPSEAGGPARGGSLRKTGLGALQVTLTHPFPEETRAGRGCRRGGGERRAPGKPWRAAPPVGAQHPPRPTGRGSLPAAFARP